jgi:glycosyltransferase involved in cell wall biosynthesis
MKILTLFFTYDISYKVWHTNGSADREINIYTKLLNHFDKVYFITYGKDDAKFQEYLPKNIIILPKKYPVPNYLYSFLIHFAYRKEIKQSTWLKTNQILGSWSAILAKIFFKKRLIVRTGFTESMALVNKNFLTNTIVTFIEFIAYKFANISIVTSYHQKSYLQKRYGVQNIHIVPNGIDINIFKPLNISLENKRTINLLFVGRLYKEKNVINLVKSLINIPNIKLTMIGNGNLKNEILVLQKKYALNITMIPKVMNSELPKIYAAADIYIQPSLYEGNPKTILEAMSCGLPVIATDVAGINNVIEHKNTGFLCDTGSAGINYAITELIQNTELRKNIGKCARNYITQNYDLNKTLAREISLYQNT